MKTFLAALLGLILGIALTLGVTQWRNASPKVTRAMVEEAVIAHLKTISEDPRDAVTAKLGPVIRAEDEDFVQYWTYAEVPDARPLGAKHLRHYYVILDDELKFRADERAWGDLEEPFMKLHAALGDPDGHVRLVE